MQLEWCYNHCDSSTKKNDLSGNNNYADEDFASFAKKISSYLEDVVSCKKH